MPKQSLCFLSIDVNLLVNPIGDNRANSGYSRPQPPCCHRAKSRIDASADCHHCSGYGDFRCTKHQHY